MITQEKFSEARNCHLYLSDEKFIFLLSSGLFWALSEAMTFLFKASEQLIDVFQSHHKCHRRTGVFSKNHLMRRHIFSKKSGRFCPLAKILRVNDLIYKLWRVMWLSLGYFWEIQEKSKLFNNNNLKNILHFKGSFKA